jgi:beta-lactam-binding protein with PASTA domain/tRNA A-37 threonylcarbamoyl transferase component Bud32
MADEIGRVLGGRYRLLSPLGAGASAQVYLADDVRLRRRVAVKILHAALADDESFLRRFRAEAQAAAALSHPHIVAVYDWSGDEATPFLVTEYLSGGSLRSILDSGHRLSPSQALVVGLEAARALDHAHRQGFVHRDIKPANLIFGADARLRIADFGLARAIAEAAWTEPTGAVLGTARYASPEQARGEPVDGRSDVYSLALVLVEGVTGTVPFSADTTIGTLMARLEHPVEAPEGLGPLRAIVEAAGTLDPADRVDAAAFGQALVKAAEELPRPTPIPLTGPSQTAPIRGDAADVTLMGHAGPPGAPAPTPPGPPSLPPGAPGALGAPGVAGSPGGSGNGHHPGAGAGAALATVALAGGPGGPGSPGATRGPVAGPDTDDTETFSSRPLPPPPGAPPAHPSADRIHPPDFSPLQSAGRPPRRWITALAVVAAVAVGAVGALIVQRTSVPTHEVPAGLVGRPFDELNDHVGEFGWRIDVEDERRDGTEPGEILGTEPGAGESLKEGGTLHVVRSQGPTLVTVPTDLVGKTRQEAEAALTAAGVELVPQVEEQPSEDVDEGRVVSVGDVAPQLPKGSTVPLVVSTGPPTRTVPDVVGMTYDDAKAELEGLGLTVERQVDENGDGRHDEVLEADPEVGDEVEPGEAVTLTVAPGRAVTVPDLQGMTLSEARDALDAEGLKDGSITGRRDGKVIGTLPVAGWPAAPGSEVQILMG